MATDAAPLNAGPFDEAPAMATPAQDDDVTDTSETRAVDKDEADTCRICRGEGTVDEPLFFPCKCSGSIKYVHQECLMEWLSHTQKKHCELCKTSFRFTKLYHPGMPSRIPTTVFIRRAALHVFNMFVTWCRGVLVGAVWLFLLPWCMRLVWRSLFWVGDGGWSRDMLMETAETPEMRTFSTGELNMIRTAVDGAKSRNGTADVSLPNPPISISYNPNNNATGESMFWTFAKRFFFGVPYPSLQLAQIDKPSHFSISESNVTASNFTSGPLALRSPSLLSDVPFFNWFHSQSANRFIVDVIEGQIITLLVVVAFILVFLIREWVVQQQPVINMVALGDNAAAQQAADLEQEAEVEVENIAVDEDELDDALGALGAEVAQEAQEAQNTNDEGPAPPNDDNVQVNGLEASEPIIRRVRRSSSLRRERDEVVRRLVRDGLSDDVSAIIQSEAADENADIFNQDNEDARNLHESLRRAMNAREEASEHQDDSQASGSSYPTRTSSLPLPSGSVSDAGDFDPSWQRPEMPARDRSFIATEIRRSLEEGKSWSFENVPQASGPVADNAEEESRSWKDNTANEQRREEPGSMLDQEQHSEHSSGSWQQVPDVVGDDSDQALEGENTHDKGKGKAVDNNEDASNESASSTGSAADSDNGITVDTTIEVDNSVSQPEHNTSTQGQEQTGAGEAREHQNEPPAAANDVQPVEPQAPGNPMNRVLDWMFGDVAPATQVADEGGNDEHVVRDLADEAPFVPFMGNDVRDHGNAPAQDAEVAAAAAQAGIDVNDQEAIEDAEDLEGILELIGMQGPLVGLFQNALFSAVLISATLACAVWLPYLWGKVVILFMGSPIALFIKLPLQVVAAITDFVVDVTLLIVAGTTYWSSYTISGLVKFCSWGTLSQTIEGPLRKISAPAYSLAESAMVRIGKMFIESPLSPGPDYFRLSVNAHASLRSLQNTTSFALNETSNFANAVFEEISADSPPKLVLRILTQFPSVIANTYTVAYSQSSALLSWLWSSKSYRITLDVDLGRNTTVAYTAMERWTAGDRLIAVLAGYGFFALAGAVYLKRGTPFSSSQQGQKIERILSDILQQAGGVLKVILIISIEMLAFPLYCGLLLDLAMLPLFKNATLYTRWQFARESPWTSGFVHWFIGTCYMFHFALFVAMCRKIMRKGVLYFIRDPDDPTFHPVRDVLERSVTTQLRKIAFSALVYGALVIVCLGGVVWTLSRATSNVLPIHWTTEAPSLEFPLDLLFYNFLTPVIIKFYKPSEGLHAMYKWCFQKCAAFLRLSNFLFGDKVPEQEGEDGRYVRAPASDQARIPKGHPVFVEVDRDNVRKDGQNDVGIHNSELVSMVFIPPWFRMRIFCFVVAIWIFMGLSGVSVTILPLLFGRYLFSLFLPPTVEMNDIHAFSLGIYTLASIGYSVYHATKFIMTLHRPVPDAMSTLHTIATTTWRVGGRVLRFSYVWASLIFVIPFLFAVLLELYFLMPLHAYLGPKEPHVVHLIQDWTLGFLYSRLAARLVFANRNSRPARAFAAVVRDGYLYPNAQIATKCFLIPVLAAFSVAIAVPASLAWMTSRTMYYGASEATKNQVWRFSFPAVGLSLVLMWASSAVVRLLVRWRLVVRDEVYLIGERLHNFGERKAPVAQVAASTLTSSSSSSSSPSSSPGLLVAGEVMGEGEAGLQAAA
ncbi:ring finger membrane protein [Stemphylium lycopersici]|uniref:RING-type E3 ubiquitin transferase n=1 Tax=Stemphylium lycopersici TaxID=183478 RepID=A0A364N956_STELY|nr:ring finger membrane protein [Stemphylium lycopersici]RAR03947.1 ring finger membrane protein [Stemphylium lycopersici]RAR13878.1 ring finger membrane protein [Stemphylium lycopersici]